MTLRALVGAGDRIAAITLPFAISGLVANHVWPSVFHLALGAPATIAGVVLLAIGVPVWLTAVVELLVLAPRGELIERGPFALVRHPIYTSVALLVLPGIGLLFDSWLGLAIGAVLYAVSRRLAKREERDLAARFGPKYAAYRDRVLLPWL